MFKVGCSQVIKIGAEGLGGKSVVVQFGCRIFFAALYDFGNGTRRTTYTNQGQALLLKPRITFQMAFDEKVNVAKNVGRHFVTGVEHCRRVYRAKGQGDGFYNLAVLEKDKLRTATTKVKDNTVLCVQGVDYPKVTDVSFRVAGDDVQLDACFFHNSRNKIHAIVGIADCSSGNGDSFIYLVDFAHIGKALHGFQGGSKGCFRKHVLAIYLLAKTQGFLLVVNHVVSTVFINMTDDKARRVGAYVDDCDSLHIYYLAVKRVLLYIFSLFCKNPAKIFFKSSYTLTFKIVSRETSVKQDSS